MPRNLKQEPHFVTTSNPAIKTVNDVNYDKRHFVPFADERDHLGRIIDSVRPHYLLPLQSHQSYMQLPPQKSYVKKLLVLRPQKDGTNKLEVGDEIPRRWKEQWISNKSLRATPIRSHDTLNVKSQSPLKNKEYYENQEIQELDQLDNTIPDVRHILCKFILGLTNASRHEKLEYY